MSAVAIPEPAFVPPLVPVERRRDAATEAVLRYLRVSADVERRRDAATEDAFDHLVAICWRATRPLFFADPNGNIIVRDIPQFSDVDGQRTGKKDRNEGTVTRQWIQEWLLGFLAPYRSRPRDEQIAAADNDQFRYLGRLCRLRLLDAISSNKPRPIHVSLDAAKHVAAKPTAEDILDCVANVYRAVLANRAELRRLDVLDGLLAILGNIEQIENQRQFERLVVESVARRRKISLQAARTYFRRFHATMVRERSANTPAIHAVFLEVHFADYRLPTAVPRETPAEHVDGQALGESFYAANGCAWEPIDALVGQRVDEPVPLATG